MYVDISFHLSEPVYRATEGRNEFMPVIISKREYVFIANPIIFRIIPLTVRQALDRHVISSFEPLDLNSPNRAGN